MAALVIETKDRSEMKLVMDLLKKMRIRAKVLTESEKEDYALGLLIARADRSKKVSRASVMKKLGQ